MPTVLIVDDEPGVRSALGSVLRDEGYDVDAVDSGEAALERLGLQPFDVVVLDVWLPGMDGLATLARMRERRIEVPVVIISGHGNIESAVRAIKMGAFDFVEKPLSLDKTVLVVRNALRQRDLETENRALRARVDRHHVMVGESFAMRQLREQVEVAAPTNGRVLITGESGTGKELVARAIHDRSPRRASPFVAVNCAAIPETLLESELFGYAPRSGISGSDPKGKPGKFEQAHGGTLFLDEIGDMSVSTQAKILRVLEDKVVDRLGGMEGIRVDLRILAATNRILEKAVADGLFREDLYYRLKVFKIDLLPLRGRREDILPLCQHFLSLHQHDSRGPPEISPRARELFLAYHWPGNIRELKNCIEEAVLLSNGRVIYPENLPSELRRDDVPQPFGTLEEVEAQHVGRVLQSVNWNKRRAAEILGINRSTLYEKIRLYGIERPREPAQAGGDHGSGTRSGNGAGPEEFEAPDRGAEKAPSVADGMGVEPAPPGF
jgi:two-component system nitrogen regulation response regulator NtrX